MRKNNKVEGIMLCNIKLCYKVIVIKKAWYWHTNKDIDQQNSPEIKLHIHVQLIYDIGGKNIQWRKERLFNK